MRRRAMRGDWQLFLGHCCARASAMRGKSSKVSRKLPLPCRTVLLSVVFCFNVLGLRFFCDQTLFTSVPKLQCFFSDFHIFGICISRFASCLFENKDKIIVSYRSGCRACIVRCALESRCHVQKEQFENYDQLPRSGIGAHAFTL